MAVDGKWEISINSPMGALKATVTMKADAGSLTGTLETGRDTSPIENGKADGNTVSFSARITQPMPLTPDFTGTVDGDALSGSVKAGAFGSFPFTGARLA